MVKNILQMVEIMETEYTDRVAVQWYDAQGKEVRQVRYGQYAADLRRFAAFADSVAGGVRGKHVGTIASNSYDYLVCFWGLALAGAVVVPMSPREPWNVLEYDIAYADVELVIAEGEYIAANPALPAFRATYDILAYKTGAYPAPRLQSVAEDQLGFLFYTSGTTANSKCVMISQQSLFYAVGAFRNLHLSIQRGCGAETERFLHLLPMYHLEGVVLMSYWLFFGKTLNMCPDFRFLMRDLKMLNSDETAVVPMVLQNWAKWLVSGKQDKLGGLKLVAGGGASVDPAMAELFVQHGITMFGGYGLTETCGAGLFNVFRLTNRYDALGQADGEIVKVKIIDGEICLQTKAAMLGYYKNEAATAETIIDGWVHTGDLGYMDEDGFVCLTGRKKNLIILASGENVCPEELEKSISANEDVIEVLVKEIDSKICAEVYCDVPNQEGIAQFVKEMNDTLPFFKRIYKVLFRTEPFEKTALGKIKRH